MHDPEEYKSLVRAIGDPVCTVDEGGTIGFVNEAFERATGYDADAVSTEPLTFVFDDAAAEQLQTETQALHETDESTGSIEATLHTSEGDTIPVECTLGAFATPDGDCGAVVVIHDITRLKQRERRLSKFASVVSHDLRNPLDVALGRAEVLPDIADVDEETEQHLDEIYDALKRMEQLIEEVLTLSRQHGELVEVSTLSFEAVVEDAWRNVKTPTATLEIVGDGEIRANRTRLLRLLENLFRNAVEHGSTSPASQTPQDAVEHGSTSPDSHTRQDAVEHGSTSTASESEGTDGVTVMAGLLDTRWDTAETGFYVADDGPGIPPDKREKVFEDGYTTSDSGTGLGLTIVQEIARSHDWTVTVTDSEAGGARFEVSGVSIPNL